MTPPRVPHYPPRVAIENGNSVIVRLGYSLGDENVLVYRKVAKGLRKSRFQVSVLGTREWISADKENFPDAVMEIMKVWPISISRLKEIFGTENFTFVVNGRTLKAGDDD